MMVPGKLSPDSFHAYPPEAKRLAQSQLILLQRLPLALLPLLLREVIVLDWKFPVERRDLDRQFEYLQGLTAGEFQKAMLAFSQLRLSPDLERTDWVNSPALFSEQLTAHLWATHQIDAFRAAAVEFVRKTGAASPEEQLPMHRLGIAVIGQGVSNNADGLFGKLKPHGVHYTGVKHEEGLQVLIDAANKRAMANPVPYGHWYIDGGVSAAPVRSGLARISYASLSPARAAVQRRMQAAYEKGAFDPETFRTMLATTRAEELGLAVSGDALMDRFQLSLLTEGSGTQVFSTTFVQWAAREVLRRAQPLTLLVRFAPRQREKPMNELLAEAQHRPELDPDGSLIDADMAAYYTWLNQQRLSGAAQARFLVWFEDQQQALVAGPALGRGKQVDSPVQLTELISQVT